MVYITMVEELRTTGLPATGAGAFVFGDAAANSALFDPYAPARRTVANAQGFNLCTGTLGDGDIFAFATTTTVATPLGDPAATSAHIQTIQQGSATGNVSAGVTGGNLVSIGLPLETMTGTPPPATAYVPDPTIGAWIAGVEVFAITEALAFNPATDVQNRLLGLPREVDALADAVWTHSTDIWGITPDDILILEARFGIYGSLPILVVWYDDGYFMIDGTNGIVAGPYLEGVEFNPGGLLLGHAEYEPGTGFAVIDSSGCENNGFWKRWRHTPPPGYSPVPAVMVQCPPPAPAGQMCPAAPLPFVIPTKPKDWIRYPYNIPGVYPNPKPPFPVVAPPTNTNPGVPGNPTDWTCVPAPSDSGQTVEFCATITEVCDSATPPNCIYRIILCVFDNGPFGQPDPPGRNGTPPDPGSDYPGWPNPITDLDGKPTGNNGNNCIDRWYY